MVARLGVEGGEGGQAATNGMVRKGHKSLCSMAELLFRGEAL